MRLQKDLYKVSDLKTREEQQKILLAEGTGKEAKDG